MEELLQNAVLALNAGSSSLKFALYGRDAGKEMEALSKGEIEEIDTAPHFVAQDGKGAPLTEKLWSGDAPETRADLLDSLLQWTERHLGNTKLIAVGHRVVHGGRDFTGPVLVTDEILGALDALTPLAPLHQPHSLEPMRAIRRLRPDLPQVACFDTAFHHTMPAVATRFALPRAYEDDGVRRYGFHGLSYEYIARQLQSIAPHIAGGRVVAAHLGSASDMRTLLSSKDPHANEAIELFVFRIVREIGALAASLGGLDGIVFTAGIGEHSPEIRIAVCKSLHWLGVALGAAKRPFGTTLISTPESRIEVHVIPTDEEAMIAHHTLETL